jgi:two-component system, NarL family, sensor histidine kinase DesK
MEHWLRKVQSRQPGGGFFQAFAVLLVFPVADSFRQHGGPWFAIPVALAMAAIHVALLFPSGPFHLEFPPRRIRPLTGILGIALMAWLSIWLSRNYGNAWSVGMLLAATECCHVLSTTWLAMGGVVLLTVLAEATVSHSGIGALVVVLTPGTIATLRRRLLVTIDELNAARTELADYAVIKERQRFSRDLHDLLGHSLSTIVVTAQLAARSLGTNPAGAERAITDIETIGRTALGEVRAAITGYRTMSFRDQLQAGRGALRMAGIDVSVDQDERCWSDDVDQVLSWAVREWITNILRHSHARHVLIALTANRQADVCLQVSDDGNAGEEELSRAEEGLWTLRERISLGGGTLGLALGDEGGLRLTVRLLLKEAEA